MKKEPPLKAALQVVVLVEQLFPAPHNDHTRSRYALSLQGARSFHQVTLEDILLPPVECQTSQPFRRIESRSIFDLLPIPLYPLRLTKLSVQFIPRSSKVNTSFQRTMVDSMVFHLTSRKHPKYAACGRVHIHLLSLIYWEILTALYIRVLFPIEDV